MWLKPLDYTFWTFCYNFVHAKARNTWLMIFKKKSDCMVFFNIIIDLFKKRRKIASIIIQIYHTPVIPIQRMRNATTDAERSKTVVTTESKYFVQIWAKRKLVFKNRMHVLKGKLLSRISAKSWFWMVSGDLCNIKRWQVHFYVYFCRLNVCKTSMSINTN